MWYLRAAVMINPVDLASNEDTNLAVLPPFFVGQQVGDQQGQTWHKISQHSASVMKTFSTCAAKHQMCARVCPCIYVRCALVHQRPEKSLQLIYQPIPNPPPYIKKKDILTSQSNPAQLESQCQIRRKNRRNLPAGGSGEAAAIFVVKCVLGFFVPRHFFSHWLTSIIKQPPDIHCPLPLFLLELLAGLQQPLVRHIQWDSWALFVCRDRFQTYPHTDTQTEDTQTTALNLVVNQTVIIKRTDQ